MRKDPQPPVSVLLVDDNVHGLTARKVILQEQGYSVETALCGEDAWDLFQKKTFDIVVTDYRMTGMDGLELIRLIGDSGHPSRTILLSGFVSCLGMTEKSTGADEVICKSNREVQDLLRSVRRLSMAPPRKQPASQKAASAASTERSQSTKTQSASRASGL